MLAQSSPSIFLKNRHSSKHTSTYLTTIVFIFDMIKEVLKVVNDRLQEASCLQKALQGSPIVKRDRCSNSTLPNGHNNKLCMLLNQLTLLFLCTIDNKLLLVGKPTQKGFFLLKGFSSLASNHLLLLSKSTPLLCW